MEDSVLTPEEKRLFDAYLAGELPDSEANALEDNLASDADLRAAFEAYTDAHITANLPSDYAPSSQFTDHVRDRIRRRSGGRFFQEDLVTTRYIPIFVVAAFVVLLVIALAGRINSDKASETDIAVVEQGEQADDAQPTRRRVTDRTHRRNPSSEDYMKPASHNRSYKDLPVSGGRTPDSVTYTRRVWMAKSKKDEAGLRAEIEEIFGPVDLESVDGYLRLHISDKEISGAYQRLEMLDAEVVYESAQVPSEEARERYIRFYYDSGAPTE